MTATTSTLPDASNSSSWSYRHDLKRGWLQMALVSIPLIYLSTQNYLAFHLLAEGFAIGVAIFMSLVVWHTFQFSRNPMLLLLALGYPWIAMLDTLHTLLYYGMPMALDDGNLPTQFWIVARLFEAIILLAAPFALTHQLPWRRLSLLFGGASCGAVILILNGLLPPLFVEGEGLSPAKVQLEYLIIAILLIATINYHRHRELIDPRILFLIKLSLLLTIAAELAFTFYISSYGFSNLVGHLFKIFSFWMIYFAIVRTTLTEPFNIMARGTSTYNTINEPLLLLDRNGTILDANQAASSRAGTTPANLIGNHCHKQFHPHDSVDQCPLCHAISNGNELDSLELRVDGDEWRSYTLTPLLDERYGGAIAELSSDISHRKRAELALRRSNDELLQYASVVAHQLQEPLRTIASHTQLLARELGDELDLERRTDIDYIVSGSKRLQRLLNQLLSYSQLGTGIPVVFDSEQALRSALHTLRHEISRTATRFRHEPLPMLFGDPVEIELLFTQLLRNAIHYRSNRDPVISLTTAQNGNLIRFSLRDEGVGIAPHHHQRIFMLFTRLTPHHEDGVEGTGIGLAMCKKIVEGHGGNIWIESGEQRGTTVHFTLPLAPEQPAE